ncbi:hypothetical protein EWH08_16495 [Sphingobium indicum]|uniref:EthD domain-containing protein n=2 Tax=Sphingobium indicum TaxID=332055 RepID=A0A1L5BTB7_SPHIB|nr:DUF4286 family protein [Sphingobium indicum]APL96128.1 hypothetical protein SIDU_17290 [Sphingobium indicum B90A]KEY99578.1 hypothetical protein AI27_02685 [Sphingomonas sp. BHC-A]NYI24100.1 hypothetical protein [Sphingobium indicum]RYL99185.1 hypothetical protein EWH08_16495 [Sphingobium indicum]
MSLGLVFVMGAPDAGADGLSLPQDALAPMPWVGRTMSSRAGEPGRPRHMLLADSAAKTDLAGAAGAWRWSGIQILPGDEPAPRNAGGLLVNWMNIDGAHEEEFNDWYDTEHVPRFRAVDGVLAARRFRASTSQPSYAAFYHLRDLDVVTGAQWREAATTPWSARILTFRHDNLRMGFTPA